MPIVPSCSSSLDQEGSMLSIVKPFSVSKPI